MTLPNYDSWKHQGAYEPDEPICHTCGNELSYVNTDYLNRDIYTCTNELCRDEGEEQRR